MSEEQTFNKLKQPSLDKMLDMLYTIEKPTPVYNLAGAPHCREEYYSEIQFHLERVMLLEKHGWKYEEFFLE